MYCSSCGTEVPEKTTTCPNCGVRLGRTMSTGMLVVGWLLAVFFPIVGLIIGIVAVSRRSVWQGIGMILLSLLMIAFWYTFSAIFFGSAVN